MLSDPSGKGLIIRGRGQRKAGAGGVLSFVLLWISDDQQVDIDIDIDAADGGVVLPSPPQPA